MSRSPSDTVRAAVIGGAVVCFLVAWAVVAGRPWEGPAAVAPRDPRMVALDRWEARVEARAEVVEAVVRRRWTVYQQRLRARLRHGGALRLPSRSVIARPPAPPVVWMGPGSPVIYTKAS